MQLYLTPSRQLDTFIHEELQPDGAFLQALGRAVHTICEFLRETCFAGSPPPRTRVLKVVKGGSAGKGTALRNSSDADLVVFLSCFKDYGDQEENRAEIIREIQRRLLQCQQQERFDVEFQVNRWPNPRVLSFQLRSRTLPESVDFDVLPAYDALHHLVRGYKVDPLVYVRLFEQCTRGGEFSTCFTELQRDFIVERPTKVKSLIRLVKHWYKEYVRGHKRSLRPGETLPPQYALELLAVYAWEWGSGEPRFSMAEAFRTVLELLQRHEQLCIYWTVNYGFEDPDLSYYLSQQLSKSRPVILDPADPTNVVGAGSRWDLVAMEAETCCVQRCCLYGDGRPVQPWDVPPEPLPWPRWGVHTATACTPAEDVWGQHRTPRREPAPPAGTFPRAPHVEEPLSSCIVL